MMLRSISVLVPQIELLTNPATPQRHSGLFVRFHHQLSTPEPSTHEEPCRSAKHRPRRALLSASRYQLSTPEPSTHEEPCRGSKHRPPRALLSASRYQLSTPEPSTHEEPCRGSKHRPPRA